MSFDAFKPATSEKTTPLEINVDAFKKGDELGGQAKFQLEKIQQRLDFMQTVMKKELGTNDLKVAWRAIEQELESVIPANFKEEYEKEGSWKEAARLIGGNILTNVNHYIGELVGKQVTKSGELIGTGELAESKYSRLAKVIETVDDADWWGDSAPKQAEAILRSLKETRKDYMQDSTENALKKGQEVAASGTNNSNSRRAADEAMNMR